ncbi:Protein CHROMATIN REMODELING 19 [Stylosanthes scabra]|uniref:Protein CHROMATIN REMODELING 19 n=1 Tax=Stylosanthes scabra TaxID=79078 RepID=A0ABU6TUE6_9FABA|nr:Protein CHROMATIN REMODELING 19 [Stylosanthes scabra]
MKREFYEISDDEWDQHEQHFKPSRVLKRPNTTPPIESFAFNNNNNNNNNTLRISADDEDDDDCVEITRPSPAFPDELDDLEDADVDNNNNPAAAPAPNRGRRFIIDDDEEEEEEESNRDRNRNVAELYEIGSSSSEEIEEDGIMEGDVVGRALHKCAKISAELKGELFGSSGTACDRYSEVESSSVRIVTQDDVDVACGHEDSDFQPLLKPYQLVGVNFLLLLYRKRIGGAILADEMGLGKTVQAITYLTLLNHLHNDPGPHLIVCPASVLENWERELKKWCPSFSTLQYHGAGRTTYCKELNSLSKAGLPPPFNVLLVCYSLFERHSAQQKDDRKILKRWRWSCVLMDEAHALKDRNSFRWKNLMAVARNANQRLMLTGTPLQNDLHQLVPKIQQVEYVVMEKQQENAYKEAIEEYRAVSQARIAKCSELNSKSVLETLPRRQINNYFVQFRKIANHPLLIRRIYSDDDVIRFARKLHPMGAFGFECTLDRVIDELKSYNDFSIHRLLLHYGVKDKKGILAENHVMLSAKCRALAGLLPSLKKDGHRVLIFSQWTSMLDILEWTLDVIGLTYKRLDGSTQVAERQTIVDTFNNNTSIFACLLSTRAGGQGLNLTGADTVVIHDMDFNPQIDRQAEDRCHRIGQTKPVTIYRLVTRGTVDENVYEIAKRKLVLDAAVLESMEVVSEGDMPEKTMGEILSAILLST